MSPLVAVYRIAVNKTSLRFYKFLPKPPRTLYIGFVGLRDRKVAGKVKTIVRLFGDATRHNVYRAK